MTKARNADLTLPGMVHDLNNIFQTLIGVAAQLEEQPGSAALASAILRSVERGQHIVAGLQGSAAEPAPLAEILSNAQAFLKDYIDASRSPTIKHIYLLDEGVELGDRWAWERVFINLFLNSARAMPSGGTIGVEARHYPYGIEITVTDEGSGIGEGMLHRLFEPQTSSHGSTGLGLTIVESIVRANGGEVRAANREGTMGAVFFINLPDAARKR